MPSVLLRSVAVLVLAAPALAAQPAKTDTVRMRIRWTPGSTADVDYHRRAINVKPDGADTTSSAWRFDLRVRTDSQRASVLELVGLRNEEDSTQVPIPKGDSAVARIRFVPGIDSVKATGGRELGARIAGSIDRAIARYGNAGPELQAVLGRLRDPAIIESQMTGTFLNAAGFWHNGALELGQEYTMPSTREAPLLPGALVPTTLHFAVTERRSCTRRTDTSCVLLVLVEEALPDSVTPLVRRILQMGGAPVDQIVVSGATMTRRWEIVAEPWTLMTYSYSQDDAFGFTLEADGEEPAEFQNKRTERLWFDWTRVPPALHAAAMAGDEGAVTAALRAGAEVDELDHEATTALYRAASAQQPGAARRLVSAKADGALAERLALARGDVAALRTLRAIGVARPRPGSTLATGRAALAKRENRRAVEELTSVAAGETAPGAAHAQLADALEHDAQDSAAVAVAGRVLAANACEATALRVLRNAHDPLRSRYDSAKLERASSYAERLATCAPASNDNWYASAWLAARRGDRAGERAALEKLTASPLFSEPQLAFGRWMLESLAPRALLVLDEELDYMTLRVLQHGGLRPDVSVVQFDALELAAYLRDVAARDSLPLPFTDKELARMDSEGEWWGVDVLNHWLAKSFDGSLRRPFAVGASVDVSDLEGPGSFHGNGALLLLTDTTRAAVPDVRVVLARLRAAERISGPPTLPSDPDLARRDYDLTRDVVWGGRTWLNNVTLDRLGYDAARLAAADTLIRLVGDRAMTVEWPGRADVLNDLAVSRMELRTAAFARGDRGEARRQAELAAALVPEQSGPLNALATSALLAHDPARAMTFARQALTKSPPFDVIVLAANTMRLAGRADTALVLLADAQQRVERTSKEARESPGVRTFLHLPAAPADTTGAVTSWRIDEFREVEAQVPIQLALAHAALGDFAAADSAMAKARALVADEAARCYITSLSAASRSMGRLSPAAEAWHRRLETALACPARK